MKTAVIGGSCRDPGEAEIGGAETLRKFRRAGMDIFAAFARPSQGLTHDRGSIPPRRALN